VQVLSCIPILKEVKYIRKEILIMRKVKYFPKVVAGHEPEPNEFFGGAIIGLALCVPFWVMVFRCVS